jgi:hypothetical protein
MKRPARAAARWSAEVRVLVDPASVFRELTEDRRPGLWVLLRRPLLLALVCGCVVSMQVSGRFSVRLIADGMISFAFIPMFEALALGAVFRRHPHGVPFARAVDMYFVANAPWLLWLIGFVSVRAFETPIQATAMTTSIELTVLATLVPVALWSAWIDLHYFRAVLPRPAGAVRDLLIERAIAWPCAIGYFIGVAIWPEIVGRILA